jgi:hypothetical protein
MAIHIRRREFIATLCGVAVAWPVAAGAQQPMPVIGWLSPGSRETDVFRLTALGRGLNETRARHGPQRGDRLSLGGGPQ